MKRVLVCVALAAALIGGLVASAAPASAANVPSLHGVVTGPDDLPASGVTVDLDSVWPSFPATVHRSTTTTSDGHYALTDFPEGIYWATFHSADPNVADHKAYLSIPAVQGEKTLDVTLQLGGRIQGSIVTPAGTSAEVTVRFIPSPGSGSPLVITVMASPSPTTYTSPLLEPGSYQVRFDPPPGSPVAYELYPNASSYVGIPWVVVPAGGTATDINASLEPSVVIDGRLISGLGQGLMGAFITVEPDGRWLPAPAMTDPNGGWSIDGLRPGQYTLTFRASQVTLATKTLTVDAAGAHGVEVTVSAGTVEGRVVGPHGEPIAADVWLHVVGSNTLASMGSTTDGRYSLPVPPGSYQLSVQPCDPLTASGWYWYHGSSQVDAEVLTVGTARSSLSATFTSLPAPPCGAGSPGLAARRSKPLWTSNQSTVLAMDTSHIRCAMAPSRSPAFGRVATSWPPTTTVSTAARSTPVT